MQKKLLLGALFFSATCIPRITHSDVEQYTTPIDSCERSLTETIFDNQEDDQADITGEHEHTSRFEQDAIDLKIIERGAIIGLLIAMALSAFYA